MRTEDAGSRQNSIGVLRLLLAAMVVYSHSYYVGQFGPEPLLRWTEGRMFFGMLAVQGFFCISGYLVTRSFLDRPLLARYAWHRFLRLAPAFWACLIVTAFVFTPVAHLIRPGDLNAEDMIGYVVNNFLSPRAQIAVGGYPPTWNQDWNGSLWTLRFEVVCYAMVAVAGVVGLLGRLRWLFLAGVLGAVEVLFVRQDLAYGPKEFLLDRLIDTPGKLLTWHFLVGSLFAIFPAAVQIVRRSWMLGLPLLALVILSWHGHSWLSPLALPPVVLWLARWVPLYRFEATVGGDYSYGLYLFAYPIQELLLVFGAQKHGVGLFFVAAMSLGLACAFVSWHVVEKNALKLR